MAIASAFLTSALCLLPSALPIVAQQRDTPAQPVVIGTATISGVVVSDDAAARPVRLARVTINNTDRTVGMTATTDDNGRFTFTAVPAGRYTLQATKLAWLTAQYGATRPGRAGTMVSVADGQRVANLTIRMARGAVVTGVVRDQRGRPAPGMLVTVMQYRLRNGERTLERANTPAGSQVRTDDTGTYRVFGLPPLETVVIASPVQTVMNDTLTSADFHQVAPGEVARARQLAQSSGASPSPGARTIAPESPQPPVQSTVTYSPVFFPGTTNFASAKSFLLAPGEEREGVDIPLQLMPTARVEGTVTGLPGVQSPAATLTLVAQPDIQDGNIGTFSTRTDKDGHYAFTGVPAGQYRLTARIGSVSGRGAAPAGNQPVFWAQADVPVDGHDQSVSLILQPGMSIAGRIVFEGHTPSPGDLAAVRLMLTQGYSSQLVSASKPPEDDSAFAFTGLLPGRYQLIFSTPAGSEWFLKSAMTRERDLLDGPFDVQPGATVKDVVATFTDRPTELAGSLQDSTRRAATDYFVIVFTTEKRFWGPGSRRIRTTRPASDGKFSLKGLPAGDYLVAALTDVESGEWYSPEFLDKLAALGVKVTLTEGQTTTQELTIKG